MKRFFLLSAALVAAGCLHGATPDGPYAIPIYIDPGTYGPSKYTIYASLGGGPLQPYLFDTGAPNLFTVIGAQGGTPTASFAFGAGTLVYSYFTRARFVSLGEKGGRKPIASTRRAVNLAEVAQINGVDTAGGALQDGTYGDFGAGLYGTSALATVLTQIPIRKDLKRGFVVDVAGRNSGRGTLTLGLTRDTIDTLRNSLGALTMQMTPSGNKIPTGDGHIDGYDRTQVGGTEVQFSFGGQTYTLPLGTVFDTGGGRNAVIYLTGYGHPNPVDLLITYQGRTLVNDPGITPWGGSPQVVDTPTGGPRVNPGGSIYQNNIVMFDLEAGRLTLVPASGTSPATFGKRGTIRVSRLGANVYEIRGRVRDANGLRAVGIFVKEGEKSKLYNARIHGGGWTVFGVQPAIRAPSLKFEVQVLDRAGETASHAYRVRLPQG